MQIGPAGLQVPTLETLGQAIVAIQPRREVVLTLAQAVNRH